jgi:putative ABC transport system permease protein
MDGGIGTVVVSVGALLGLLAATVPATWATRASLSSLLASAAVRGGGGQGRLRRSMIVVQVALSLILLSSGALVVRSLAHLLRSDPGFRPEGLLTLRVRTPPEFFPQPSDATAFQDRVEGALAAIPGVISASATSALPLSASAPQASITFPGAPGNSGHPEQDAPLVDVIGTRAGYVEVMGMRLLAGRDFDRARRTDLREALVDARLARRFFPGGNPVGAKMSFGDDSLTIAGVVEQARLYDIHQDGRPQVLVRAEDWGYRPLFYVLRTTRDPRALIPEARSAVARIERRVAVGDARTMDEIVADALRPQQTSAVLITALALGALLLAAMGLFGVISGSVTRRRHELAVRMALGADHRRALGFVLREGALLVGIGVLIGVPGIYGAGRLIRGVLVGISPSDPLTLVAVALGLALVSMAACYVPARRVLAIEPAQLLREG